MVWQFTGRPRVDSSQVVYHVDGDVGYLTLSCPPGNALTAETFAELDRICCEYLPRQTLRGLVVSGAGRHFSSGADVDELRRLVRDAIDGDHWFLTRNVDALCALESLPYTVVAAVRGCCLGAGLELALACHYRVAAPRATIALPESTFGLMPGCGGTVRLAETVGMARAVEMILSGQAVLAEDALAMGLVDAVVSRHRLIDTARDLAVRAQPHVPSGGGCA